MSELRFVAACIALLAVTHAPARAARDRAAGLLEILDRPRVIELSRAQAPEVLVARARIDEARALRSGAGAPAPANPELAVAGGPRLLPNNTLLYDWSVSLQWPVDLSGARHARLTLAEESVRAAEAEALAVARTTTAEALDLWMRTLNAIEQVRLEAQRATLDAGLVEVAQARRRAGTTGDADVALALVVQAQGLSRLRSAESERDAWLTMLRTRLGLDATTQVELVAAGLEDEPPPLPQLLAALAGRADLLLASSRQRVAHADASLQRRVSAPVPRLTAAGGRSNEYYFEGGVQVPLPLYQRNQTNRAVAEARAETSRIEERAARRRAEGEVGAAYTLYLGARAAYRALADAIPAMTDADHLATRGYQLGQGTLASALSARREVVGARMALLDAQLAVRRTRLGVDVAAGLLP